MNTPDFYDIQELLLNGESIANVENLILNCNPDDFLRGIYLSLNSKESRLSNDKYECMLSVFLNKNKKIKEADLKAVNRVLLWYTYCAVEESMKDLKKINLNIALDHTSASGFDFKTRLNNCLKQSTEHYLSFLSFCLLGSKKRLVFNHSDYYPKGIDESSY